MIVDVFELTEETSKFKFFLSTIDYQYSVLIYDYAFYQISDISGNAAPMLVSLARHVVGEDLDFYTLRTNCLMNVNKIT